MAQSRHACKTRWKRKSDSMCMWRNGQSVNIILVSINKQILCIAVLLEHACMMHESDKPLSMIRLYSKYDQVVQLAWVWSGCSYSLHESSLAGPIVITKTPRTTHWGWNRTVMAWTEMVLCPDSHAVRKNIQVWKCGYIYSCATTLKSWSLAHHSPYIYFWDISYPLASKFLFGYECVNLRQNGGGCKANMQNSPP